MRELAPNELFLQSKAHVLLARNALAMSGINPEAEQQLTNILAAQEMLADNDDKDTLVLYMQGDVVAQTKADIIRSLESVDQFTSAPTNAFAAAHDLLALLRDS